MNVVTASPGESPRSPSSSSSSGSSSRSGSSEGSTSSTESEEESQEVLVEENGEVLEENGGLEQTVIQLSSDSEVENGEGTTGDKRKGKELRVVDRSSSPSSRDEGSEGEEGDLHFVQETKKMLESLAERLTEFKKKCGGRKKKRARTSPGEGENPGTGGGDRAAIRAGEEEREKLKQKLVLLTKELGVSRAQQVKRLRQNKVRDPVVIEIQDDPVEFYDMNVDLDPRIPLGEWFRRFNETPAVRNNRQYSAWIQERVTNLFSKVLTILGTTWVKGSAIKSHHLQSRDFLQCRGLSKDIKISVDKLLQGETSQRLHVAVQTHISSLDGVQLRDFVQFLHRHEGSCPFPSKSLVVHDLPVDNLQTLEAFKAGVDRLLQKFGGHVTRFTFLGYQGKQGFFADAPNLRGWSTLSGWLREMGNLTEFNFQLGTSEPLLTTVEQERLRQSRALYHHPFPILPKLHTLEFRRVPSVFINTVLDGNEQSIKEVRLFFPSLEEPSPNLYSHVNLHLSEFSAHIAQFSQLEPLGRWVQWPLRKLTLIHCSAVSSALTLELFNLHQVFRFVEKFQGTLEQLHLNLGVTSCPSHAHLQLNLPLLQNLTVCFIEAPSSKNRLSYDFLVPLMSLQYLEVVIASEDNDKTEDLTLLPCEAILFKGYLHRLYQSNMWSLFPSLKLVKVVVALEERGVTSLEKYNYTREGFEARALPQK